MTNSTIKPTKLFWVISILAFIWNIMGVMAYLGHAYITDEALSLLSSSEQDYYNNLPVWVTAAFAIAVFTGLFGCLALLLRKKMATNLFIISLIAVLAQFVYNFFIQEFMEISGSGIMMPVLVIFIAIFLIWFSKKSTMQGWIS